MKPFPDMTAAEIEFNSHQDPDKYRRIVGGQRAKALAMAEKVEQGQDLDEIERKSIASLLRNWATNLSDKPKGKQGPKPKFDPGGEAFIYAAYRFQGMRHGEAIALIADRVGASETAVVKGVKKYRAAAFEFLGIPDPGNQ